MSDNFLLGAGYTYGMAKREAIEELINLAESKAQSVSNSTSNSTFMLRTSNALKEFLDDQSTWQNLTGEFYYFGGDLIGSMILDKWAARLIINGRQLDDQLDQLLSNITILEFDWHSRKKQISEELRSVLIRREDIRAFEREVEDYLEGVSETTMRDFDVLPVTQLLNQLQRTYDRSYDLCTFKITTINTARATMASILIAAVATIIAIASYLSANQ